MTHKIDVVENEEYENLTFFEDNYEQSNEQVSFDHKCRNCGTTYKDNQEVCELCEHKLH